MNIEVSVRGGGRPLGVVEAAATHASQMKIFSLIGGDCPCLLQVGPIGFLGCVTDLSFVILID